ncbi:Zn-dependent protease with chaperone function [Desulfosporosinus sp. I2]|uniref:M48 family metallopeptidase n=1 Tax=Desulfosporosinus sp. I2 TaxID=1617025 RepID=UPI00061F6991|nr:M48 family metallopeptidase [Desulfosporosinus sp. I2]KJR49079.1 Zn-dependent protease with chaperone function [Desulfosporosinus sp. I2]
MFNHKRSARRAKIGWFFLIGLAAIFAFLYLWSALFPGPIDPLVTRFFSPDTANEARIYNSTPRILYILKFCFQTSFLIWLLFSSVGQTFLKRLQEISRNYWLACALSILSIWLLLKVLSLPFSYYSGYYWQKIWGFSTQTQAAWWIDYLKNCGIELLISLVGGLIFFWLVNRLSRNWWLVSAVLFSLWLIIESICWPIVISPLFNHFEPLPNSAILTMVDDLAQRAGLNLSAVLVMDASRQTTLANAYFTGVGTTQRIVIYDTLLRNYSFPEVKAVIAHEMGHWRHNDVVHGLFYGMIGGFIVFGLLTILLRPWLPKNVKKTWLAPEDTVFARVSLAEKFGEGGRLSCPYASRKYITKLYFLTSSKKPPQLWAALQLALLLLLFVSNPLQSAISREMELSADRFSLELTGDLNAEIQLQKDLARIGLSDLSPPRFIVWFSYSHPPALARINALEQESQHRN